MIFPHIPVTIKRQEVVRYLGYKKHTSESNEAIDHLIDKSIRDAAYVLDAKGVIRHLTITSKDPESWKIECNDGEYCIQGERIFRHLQQCELVTLMVVTVGEELDKKVEHLFNEQLPTKALILDAIGSDAVERAADYVDEYIKKVAARKGYGTRFRYSPGYGGWSIEHQWQLLKAVGGATVGVTVTDTFQLQPRKSVSAVIGWFIESKQCSLAVDDLGEQSKCHQCDTNDCQFRN